MKKGTLITSLVFSVIATLGCVMAVSFMFNISAIPDSEEAATAIAGALVFTIFMGVGLVVQAVSTAFALLFAGISVPSDSAAISLTAKILLLVLILEIAVSAVAFFVLL